MYDSDSKGISFTAGFFMLIAFTIGFLFAASLISMPIWSNMTGKSVLEMEKYLTVPAYSNAIKIIQVVTAIIGMLLPPIFTAFLMNKKPLRLLGFFGRITWKQVGLVFAIIVAALFVSGGLAYLNQQIPVSAALRTKFEKMENDYLQQVQAIVSLNNTGEYLLSLFIIAFLPALCEETLFRGGLQNFLAKSTRNYWFAVIIVSIIFSATHFSYFGFLSRFFLGMVLGLIYQFSGRLWLSILAHFLNNAVAVTVLYIYKMQGKPMKEAMEEPGATAYWGLLLVPVLIALLLYFKKQGPQAGDETGNRNEALRNTPFY